MRVLGIDPGTVTLGYGVIEEREGELASVDYGALTTAPNTPLTQRLHTLYLGLLEIIARNEPTVAAIEEPFVAKNARSALAVGMAMGMAIVAAAENGVPIHQYTPTQVKQAVASYGRSGKEQVQEMVRIQLGLPSIPQPSDAADALAVALCHIQQMHLARVLRGEHTEGR
jgi:crossover junction endodeoxyribonuclease RuvC